MNRKNYFVFLKSQIKSIKIKFSNEQIKNNNIGKKTLFSGIDNSGISLIDDPSIILMESNEIY